MWNKNLLLEILKNYFLKSSAINTKTEPYSCAIAVIHNMAF